MAEPVKAAFSREILILPIAQILPLRHVNAEIKKKTKYRRIAASIAEIGIIEPLVVTPSREREDAWLLLDGHLRLAVLLNRGSVIRAASLPTTTRPSPITSASTGWRRSKSTT